ncbi:MAG: hypothetical protein JO264_02085 [Acidisphaera sp.]|nr:hypothetical protein [Acidisphaera sp.]
MAGLRRRDGAGIALIALSLAALLTYRRCYVEPRLWGALCAAAAPPLACAPRAALLWLQEHELWGLGALLLGLAAFVAASDLAGMAAVALGVAAVVNYNASWGMLGAALGAWSWIRLVPGPGRAADSAAGTARPAPARPRSTPATGD